MHSFLDWASELQTLQRQFDANPKAGRRLTPVEKRAIEVAMRLSTYQAYSGDRVQTAGLVLIMPRPSNAKYLADTARAIKEAARRSKARRACRSSSSTSSRRSPPYWNNIPQDDRHDPTEDAEVRRTLHRLASRQFGLGPAQGVLEVEAGGPDRGRIPREPDARRSWTRITRSSRPNRARRVMCPRTWPRGF